MCDICNEEAVIVLFPGSEAHGGAAGGGRIFMVHVQLHLGVGGGDNLCICRGGLREVFDESMRWVGAGKEGEGVEEV